MHIPHPMRVVCAASLTLFSLLAHAGAPPNRAESPSPSSSVPRTHVTETPSQPNAASASSPAIASPTLQRHESTQDKADHLRSEWWLIGLTGALAFFTAWLVLETRRLVGEAIKTSTRQAGEMRESLGIATQAARAAEGAANTALVAQRPWISCKVEVAGPITYSPEGNAQFHFRLTATNVGHTPAMGVRLFLRLNLLSPEHEHSILQLLRLTELNRGLPAHGGAVVLPGSVSLGNNETGVLLFPGETHSINYRLPLNRGEIVKSCDDIKPNLYFMPEVFGLATYTYPLAAVRADTGFVYQVERAKPVEHLGTAFGLDEVVQAEQITISEHQLWGSFAT